MDYETSKVFELVDAISKEMGVDPKVAKMIIGAEQVHTDRKGGWKLPANFSDRASSANAQGVGQVIPSTQRALMDGGFLPADYKQDGSLRSQIQSSVAALKEMMPRAGGDPLRLAALYNGGTAAGKAYGTPAFSSAPTETQNHVEKARHMMNILNNQGGQRPPYEMANSGTPAPVAPAADPIAAGKAQLTDLAAQMQQFMNAMNGASESANAAVRGYTAVATEAGNERAVGLAAMGVAETAAAQAASLANAKKEAQREAINEVFKVTTADMQGLRDSYVSTEAQRVQLETKINEQMAVGFFDNPLQYLMNATTLPGLVQQHNSLASKADSFNNEIAQRQDMSSKQQQVTGATIATEFAAEQAAKAASKVAQAQIEAAGAKEATAATSAKNMLTELNVVGQQMGNVLSVQAAARAQLSQDQAFNELDTKKKQEREELTAINMLLAPLGSRMSEQEMKTMPAAQRAKLTTLTARSNYGNSMEEAYQVITGLDLYNRNNADKSIAIVMDQISKELPMQIELVKKGDAMKQLKGAEIEARALQSLERQWTEGVSKNINREAGRGWTPYAIDYQYIHASGREKGNFIGTALEKLAAKNQVGGANTARFDNLADEALVAIKAGTLTPADAATKLAQFYNGANEEAYKARGLALFHLPKAEGYYVEAIGGKKPLDATNRAQLAQYFTIRNSDIVKFESTAGTARTTYDAANQELQQTRARRGW